MILSIVALLTALVSAYLVFAGLRMIAQDTAQTLTVAAQRAYTSGQLAPRAAFALLWVMIFVLSYL